MGGCLEQMKVVWGGGEHAKHTPLGVLGACSEIESGPISNLLVLEQRTCSRVHQCVPQLIKVFQR